MTSRLNKPMLRMSQNESRSGARFVQAAMWNENQF